VSDERFVCKVRCLYAGGSLRVANGWKRKRKEILQSGSRSLFYSPASSLAHLIKN